ncbi:hypothetical protein L210DRAFT_2007918 [Boletus edulis BED1]|uniref:Uncharacterized protein n=1 Tax=Boletus edulis BED1 TaxID=1328754 RepID=A0AAD4GL44_BOLED|nr:hypothetical protein L210DRAFT_2007918 [Boletus edulis BED1]
MNFGGKTGGDPLHVLLSVSGSSDIVVDDSGIGIPAYAEPISVVAFLLDDPVQTMRWTDWNAGRVKLTPTGSRGLPSESSMREMTLNLPEVRLGAMECLSVVNGQGLTRTNHRDSIGDFGMASLWPRKSDERYRSEQAEVCTNLFNERTCSVLRGDFLRLQSRLGVLLECHSLNPASDLDPDTMTMLRNTQCARHNAHCLLPDRLALYPVTTIWRALQAGLLVVGEEIQIVSVKVRSVSLITRSDSVGIPQLMWVWTTESRYRKKSS